MTYKPIISHDIDFVTKYKSPRNLLGAIRRKPLDALSIVRDYNKSKKDITRDPYWTMEEMLDINNSFGIETHFYFKTAVTNPQYDWNSYNISDPNLKELLINLVAKGAIIGLHPSYESYLDADQIKREKDLLQNALGKEVVYSRQHFLRYEDPLTFKYLAEAGIQQDSSIGYTHKIGIKGNSSKPYIIFKNEKTTLVEQPFLMMETHLINEPKSLLSNLESELDKIKEEFGVAMIIWHNNNYETNEQKALYKKVLQLMAS